MKVFSGKRFFPKKNVFLNHKINLDCSVNAVVTVLEMRLERVCWVVFCIGLAFKQSLLMQIKKEDNTL